MQHQQLTIAQIKENARDVANKASRNTSALSLIRSAKQQCIIAIKAKKAQDPREALSAYMKAGVLTRLFMNSEEFKREAKAKGVLYKEFVDFSQVS